MLTISLFVTDIWGQGQSHYLTTRAHGECQWEWSGPASVTWRDRLLEAAFERLSYLSLDAASVTLRFFLLYADFVTSVIFVIKGHFLLITAFVTLINRPGVAGAFL